MKKELLSPTNFNVLASKLSDVLVKALDAPLGYAINWGRVWSLWPVHLETACCSVEFGQLQAQDTMSKGLVLSKHSARASAILS